jgi:predicted PurR-regulated permease PerM
MDFWTIIADLGMPIAAAVACGVFIMIVINYILSSIVGSIDFIKNVTESLDNRIKTMNNDILKIDHEVSEQLGLPVDTDRVARADGKEDARKD